jgi:hypothetical protein
MYRNFILKLDWKVNRKSDNSGVLVSFWFTLVDDITVKPFDFITFDRSHKIKTSGIIQDLQFQLSAITSLSIQAAEEISIVGITSALCNIIDKDTKMNNIVRLNRCKMIMIHLRLYIQLKLHFQIPHLREDDNVKPRYLIDV